ncbi:MAG TPA: plastocyanin/azurin family copper-binding protein [Nitrososphaerales archaeon]|nr:plastocyanin/azurin family copper-binding protein [Nitrososphaerales archaeon]
MSNQTSTAVAIVVAMLIFAAIATLGYYQFDVAGNQTTATTSSTSTTLAVTCPSAQCVNVTINTGAGSAPPGYSGGKTTYGYTPDVVTVVIGKNNTVFWTNDDTTGTPHTVTSDTAGIFDSGSTGPLTSQGGTFQFTFTTPGTYGYHCSFHSWMQGTVIVLAGTGTNSSTTSSQGSSTSTSSTTSTTTSQANATST